MRIDKIFPMAIDFACHLPCYIEIVIVGFLYQVYVLI